MAPDTVTLEDVINGRRCTPLTAQEFELFLQHKAHSLENLQFHHWYTDYRQRWQDLSPELKASCPPPAAGSLLLATETKPASPASWSLLASWSSAGSSQRGASSAGSSPTLSRSHHQSPAFGSAWPPLPDAIDPANSTVVSSRTLPLHLWRRRGSKQDELELENSFGSICHPGADLRLRRGSKDTSSDLPAITVSTPSSAPLHPGRSLAVTREGSGDIPFAEEVARVVSSFLRPGAISELNIDSPLRALLFEALGLDAEGRVTGTTHPDVFQRVEEICWTSLRDHSLPDFLRFASSNINQAKTYFWLAIGTADIAIGLLISLCCLFFVHSRWARLPGLLPICFGCMQIYSAGNHFCTQVYGRAARQLYPWELSDPTLRRALESVPEESDAASIEKGSSLNLAVPWQSDDIDTLPVVTSFPGVGKRRKSPNFGVRMPIFAPETPVKDAYVAQVQARLLSLILVVGVLGTLCFGAILLPLPEQ